MKNARWVAVLLSLAGAAELAMFVPSITQGAVARPDATAWTKSKSLLDGISRFPLMTQLVRSLQDAPYPELSPCSNESAIVTDPQDPTHLQSKAFAYTTGAGITSLTIINRATERDEILTVQPSRGIWAFHTQPSYAQQKPTPAANAIKGDL